MHREYSRKKRQGSESSMEQHSRTKGAKQRRGESPFASSDDSRSEGERRKRKTVKSRSSSYESDEGEKKISTSHRKTKRDKSGRITQKKKSPHRSDEHYTSSSAASSPRRGKSSSEGRMRGRRKAKMDQSSSESQYSSVNSEDKSSQGRSPSTPSLSASRASVRSGSGRSEIKGRNKSSSASEEDSDEYAPHEKKSRQLRGDKRGIRGKDKHKSSDEENQSKELEKENVKKGNRKRKRHHSSGSSSSSASQKSEVKKRIRPNERRSEKRENRRSASASSRDTDVGRSKKKDGKDPKRGKRRRDKRSESFSSGSVHGGESQDSSWRSRHSGDGTSSSGGSSGRARRKRGKGTSSSQSGDSSDSIDSSQCSPSSSDEGKKRKKVPKLNRRKVRQVEKPHDIDDAYDPFAEDEHANLQINEELIEYAKQKIANVTTEDIGRAGGVYIPPFKLERLKKEVTNKKSALYQKQEWMKLKKKINNIVNKVNVDNIGDVCYELFECNLIRGKGIFSRALIHAQLSSPSFTHVFAALLCIINSKFPTIGLLTIQRIILHFRRSYKRNDKIVCLNSVKFIAHMINQRVIHEIVGLQLCSILLQNITNDSVQVCTYFLAEVGQLYMNICRKGIDIIFDRLKDIIQEGKINIKTQYDIEKLWTYRKNYFREFPTILEDLDLIDEEEKIVHEIDLLDETFENQEELNIFREVPPEQYEEENIEWDNIAKELLHGDASGGGRNKISGSDESHSASSPSDQSSTDSENEQRGASSHSDSSDGKSDDENGAGEEEDDDQAKEEITDMTEQYLINLRKNVYLSIMSSLSFEECVHKLLKLNIKKGYEIEICNMLIDCCCMEKTFQKFYALQAERLCKLKSIYQENFEKCFQNSYNTAHRLETAKLRNCAKLFAHLLYTDAISWNIFLNIKLSEEDTTSSTRIFLKILLQELTNNLGMQAFYHKINHPAISPFMSGLFPTDNAQDMRFCVNFFTAIGLGALTASMRKLLQG
ncbi:Uncharacterized protein PCOAH_00052850 [Plasmodium coatneyi]|uniref:MI domain-containing protein n=1 Tax=Plasmodium coatneyi TaxID=208452 RepID=A0A1B1E7Z2_9APIC|nr:Uncharacterized protein PCOAH_00052850 [Plasmodium coatneyi]ANQ11108.1 Uncharacterized protein PCOAH_00052850 [Plasmodium coatneyi]